MQWLGLVLGLSRTRRQQNALYYFYPHREWIINVYISAAFWNNLSLGLCLGLLKTNENAKTAQKFSIDSEIVHFKKCHKRNTFSSRIAMYP